MPNQKPAKTKQRRSKRQSQEGHSPSDSQIVRADAPTLDNLQRPDAEQGNEPQARQNADTGQRYQQVGKPFSRIEKPPFPLTTLPSNGRGLNKVSRMLGRRAKWRIARMSPRKAHNSAQIRRLISRYSPKSILSIGGAPPPKISWCKRRPRSENNRCQMKHRLRHLSGLALEAVRQKMNCMLWRPLYHL